LEPPGLQYEQAYGQKVVAFIKETFGKYGENHGRGGARRQRDPITRSDEPPKQPWRFREKKKIKEVSRRKKKEEVNKTDGDTQSGSQWAASTIAAGGQLKEEQGKVSPRAAE